eukprot:TRINITY_DN2600_c0_g1_i1.p1 TRINITY_DN2600_c0_g1~~TRINITY_DN2600_c0_g1_i1.p1  ORF type:complete len:402 (-),score=101.84 TRINITY_DN2600_c0_g1_i1:62-1153(-)
MAPKALILVGGYGTRLRPLTLSKPKPMVEFANKAIVMHQIEALVKAGVNEIVLAVSYQSDVLATFLQEQAKHLNIKVHISKEDEPLGTAGPLALAKDFLKGDDPFFVLNSDVISKFPFTELLRFHQNHGKEGTLLVTRVKDPSKYGVILSDDTGKISRFVEKPKDFVGDCINAGMYIFNSAILDRIQPRPTSIEREIFPAMAEHGELYSMVLPGFWMDIGQPKDYLRGLKLYLHHLSEQKEEKSEKLASGSGIHGSVIIHSSAKVGAGCKIGPDVTIGPGCIIEDGVRLENCAILDGTKVRSGSYVRSSIIGWNCVLGRWSHLQDGVVLGEDVQVGEGVVLIDVQVLPHKGLKDDELEARVIM